MIKINKILNWFTKGYKIRESTGTVRTVTYRDDKVVDLLLEYKELSKEVANLTDQITLLEEQRSKTAIRGQKVKDKTNLIVKKLVEKDEGEFEVTSKVEVDQDRNIVVEFADMLEDWKKAYKERNKK